MQTCLGKSQVTWLYKVRKCKHEFDTKTYNGFVTTYVFHLKMGDDLYSKNLFCVHMLRSDGKYQHIYIISNYKLFTKFAPHILVAYLLHHLIVSNREKPL